MEAAPIGLTHLLMRSIVPIGLIGACVGLLTIGSSLLPLREAHQPARARDRESTRADHFRESAERGDPTEKVAVVLCALVSVLGLVVAVQIFRYRATTTPAFPPAAVLFCVALLTLALPAVFWRTSGRPLAEGVATIGAAAASFVTGFSIGLLFVPLVLLMTLVCLKHFVYGVMRARRHRPMTA